MVVTFPLLHQLVMPLPTETTKLSQNCLFVCDFNLHFTYMLTGWEGSTSDSHILGNACSCNLEIHEGQYLLGNLGFASKASLLVPY